jgi:hypothetical protein
MRFLRIYEWFSVNREYILGNSYNVFLLLYLASGWALPVYLNDFLIHILHLVLSDF